MVIKKLLKKTIPKIYNVLNRALNEFSFKDKLELSNFLT